MSKKLREKIKHVKIGAVAIITTLTGGVNLMPVQAKADSCPDLSIVFARGSGGERWKDQNYLAFKDAIEEKLTTTTLSYEFVDLDYPAIGVGIDNLGVTLGAFFGAGETFEFGASVDAGVKNLINLVNSCPTTKYVIGGYSQGAMVISKVLSSLNHERIIYAATFGDPKIYLPEGAGIIPAACKNENLSDYRMYVPDCQAYKGLLGAYIPYEPASYVGKLGTWCNKRDIFCSSHFSVTDHTSYVSENLYEDASRVIFNKITEHFGIENHITSPHDTAFLIDSTGSMIEMIDQYKAEALRLAEETLNSGGRIALYDYRDLDDPYEPKPHCAFETCTLENFKAELDTIEANGGGDELESLLSASLNVMNTLNWKYGSTKSMVVLTDAGFLAPDRDGITLGKVVALSKEIDPVNFYIITDEYSAEKYTELAQATDGKVVTNFDELSLLTDYIMERFDSLPKVEETEAISRPYLEIIKSNYDNNKATISFNTNGEQTIVVLNDQILGTTTEKEITIDGLKNTDTLILVPVQGDYRGDGEVVYFNELADEQPINFVPKAPNTGRQ